MYVEKGQFVRLVDVFILGPFMMWFGYQAKGIDDIYRYTMIIVGFLTIIYNGRNYLINIM